MIKSITMLLGVLILTSCSDETIRRGSYGKRMDEIESRLNRLELRMRGDFDPSKLDKELFELKLQLIRNGIDVK